MKDNPIRQVADSTRWVLSGAGNRVRFGRKWIAICPDCKQAISATGATYCSLGTRATRKTAKDALYRHQQQEHKPGLVGR